MIEKAVKAVIDRGIAELQTLMRSAESASSDAQEVVKRCKDEICSLIKITEDLPKSVFSNYLSVSVSTLRVQNEGRSNGMELSYEGQYAKLTPITGSETLRRGKYRAILLIERVGDNPNEV